MFLWMLWALLLGLIYSIVMIIIGTIISIVCHPFQTLASLTLSLSHPFMANLVVSVIDLIRSILKPLIDIFYWKF